MTVKKENKKPAKKENRLVTWFKRCFLGSRKELSFMEEEALQSPGKTVVMNFLHKPTAVVGLVLFLVIFLFVMIAPYYMPIDLSYQDSNLANIAPCNNMMEVPQEMIDNGVADIAASTTFGIGTDKTGKTYTWGYTRVTNSIDLGDMPEDIDDYDLTMIAAGTDHAVALDSEGEFHFWGNDRLGQAVMDNALTNQIKRGKLGVVQLEASNQFSAIVTDDHNVYLWGNPNNADIKVRSVYEGQIEKVALTDYAYISLLTDGSVAYTGFSKDSPLLVNMPKQIRNPQEGEEPYDQVKIVDIAATSQGAAAVDENGKVWVWGNNTHGENQVPEFESKPVEIYGGRFHYTVLLEDGDVVSWGDTTFNQANVPDAVNNAQIATIFAGGYQNYAVTTDGEVITWGLRGYLCGTDDLGRDVLARLVNGGKTTMTVGAISVVIATIIGVLLGGVAGYFGGKTDIVVMRISEIISSLPFIPFAMILSAVIGSSMSTTNRMYLIMVVLGVLSWTGTCRLVRAQFFAQREMEYVTAAKTMGVKEGTIIIKHILPNVMSVLMVSVTLSFATCMLTESTLSYLGFGIPLPTPTWGNMLTGANNSIVIQQFWWRWVFPASIFGLCTICINLIGDGLRDAMDPKSAER